MFQSDGALVKSTTTLWQGPVRDWPGSPMFPGLVWSSYTQIYRSQLWVSTVVDKRGKAAARLPFKVYARSDGSRTDASASPFGQLMARPSKSIDPFLFWLWTVNTKDIHGEAVWVKVRDRGRRPVELIPLHPTKLIDETDQAGKVTWTIRLSRGDITVDRADLVIHREFNPDCVHRGMSKLEPLRATLENEDGARRANSAIWRNGGRPSMVLQHPGLMNDGAVKRLSAQWNDIHGGVDNWAKAAILEEGMTAQVIPLSVDDLQYVEARRLNREEVCAAFDIPPPVVHILDRATFSNITEQMRSMYRDTMGTVLGALESTVEFELRDGRYGAAGDPDFGDGFYGEFLLDEVLRGAFEARAAAFQQADYMTLAEKREKENLPFIDGTDHIFLNSATLPLGPDGLLTQPAAVMAPASRSAAPVVAPSARSVAWVGESGPELRLRVPDGYTNPRHVIAMRSVMGRLARAKTLANIDPAGLVAGLADTEAIPVLQELVSARLAVETVDQFKRRLRALPAGKDT